MKRLESRRQRGIALIAFLAIVAIGVSALLLKHLNDESGLIAAIRKNRNAEVLNRAKQALIGYVAHQAAVTGENNPGAFPCPEASAGYGSTTGTDGRTQTPSCTLPAVGRFPWRTIGTDMLVDSAGEPLWYVVASGWSKPSSTGNTVINSNCTTYDVDTTTPCFTGQLTVDGESNAAVALIISPGPAFSVSATANCAAVNQVRPATGPPNLQNYLECQNATSPADATFVTTGPSGSFNDQVMKITAAEILPAIEAAIADRFQKEFAPDLRTAYSASPWPTAQVLPFAAAFGDPTIDPARKLQGAAVISGTAAVTNGSATVTLSAAPNPASLSIAGRHFRVQGSVDAFLVSSHTAGSTTLTLSSVFTGATNGAASIQVFVAGGLMPATYGFAGQCTCASPPCVCPTPTACSTTDPRCDPSFVTWRSSAIIAATGGGGIDSSSSCSVSGTPTTLTCTLNTYYNIFQLFGSGVTFNLYATANNVGMTWRKLNAPVTPTVPLASTVGVAIGGIDTTYTNSPFGYNVTSLAVNTDGSATIRVNARVPVGGSVLAVLGSLTCDFFGIPLCYARTVTLPMAMLGDQYVLDPNNTTTNWFFRNKWHEVSYYAVAPNVTPSGPLACSTSTTCLQVTGHVDDGKHRGLLVIGGPKVAAQVRPALVAADLLDGANALGVSPFEKRSATLLPNRAFNDRFAVIDSNP